MLPDIHSIEFLDGWYVAHAPPATFWSVKCMEVAEVKDLMNCTNQWLKTIINLVNFTSQTQIWRSEPAFTAHKPADRAWNQHFPTIPPVIGFWYRQGGVIPYELHETAYALAVEIAAADLTVTPEELRLLDMLRDFLKVDKLAAAAIERGARARFRKIPK